MKKFVNACLRHQVPVGFGPIKHCLWRNEVENLERKQSVDEDEVRRNRFRKIFYRWISASIEKELYSRVAIRAE